MRKLEIRVLEIRVQEIRMQEIRVWEIRVREMMVVDEEDEGESFLAFYVHLLIPLLDIPPHQSKRKRIRENSVL